MRGATPKGLAKVEFAPRVKLPRPDSVGRARPALGSPRRPTDSGRLRRFKQAGAYEHRCECQGSMQAFGPEIKRNFWCQTTRRPETAQPVLPLRKSCEEA